MKQDLVALREDLKSRGIDVLRFIYSDVIGVTRSKDVLVSQLDKAAHNGPAFCQGVWVTTTRGGVLDGGNIATDGLQDMVSQLDPDTITPMPWEPGVAYVVVDAKNPDGTKNLFSPRGVLRKIVEEYNAIGLKPVVGPELEFYIADRTPEGGFKRSLKQTGRVYTTGAMVDPNGTFLHLMRMLDQMNIGVFAGNHEFSPSQYEINLWHGDALNGADRTFMFKTAIKDIVARTGQHATFLGKPWSDESGSGFHLHFSVTDMNDNNVMHDGLGNLSETARKLIAGLVENAGGLVAFTNPTVNAFKRLGPDTLAPYRANWGYDNRSCMVRIPPERGGGTRLEVRVGDGAANPYLVIAGILAAGLDGIKRNLECPDDAVGMAYDNEAAAILPGTFTEALDELEKNERLRENMSDELIDVFLVMKRDEIERYNAEVGPLHGRTVTQWEIDEYMEDF
ncbi:glutamine synthetase family protein [Candidatus Rhodoluna planktonica]|uniref:glutamine synthetase n=1 Tax=Candidatus Rhodoluna planktonica TaxID=535712 RepID=A0A1D9E0A7_9MICO|nr:glutamine synthetase family protein [Candidatus Rhodoluna planktonica]AOY56502.1 glutamine synthetase [Candidatus Rhodoluna planktonica]